MNRGDPFPSMPRTYCSSFSCLSLLSDSSVVVSAKFVVFVVFGTHDPSGPEFHKCYIFCLLRGILSGAPLRKFMFHNVNSLSFSLQRIWVHFLMKLLFVHTTFDAMCPLRIRLRIPMHPLVILLVLYTVSLVQPDSSY